MIMEITIDMETCIACGNCYSICPKVFDCNEEGIAFCKFDNNDLKKIDDTNFKSLILECRDSCPTESIVINNNLESGV